METSMNIEPVLTFGEPLVVCIPATRGSLSSVREFQTDAAGAELNTAIGLARLHVPVWFSGSVGADPFGHMIHRQLRSEGIDVSCFQRIPQRQTGVFFKQAAGLTGETQVFYYRSTSPMASGDWDGGDLIKRMGQRKHSWVHTTGITWMVGKSAYKQGTKLLEAARASEIPVSFDVNLRLKMANLQAWKDMITEVLPLITWLLLGDSEAVALYGSSDAVEIESYVRTDGFIGKGVIVKEGSNGATASMEGVLTHVNAVPVSQVIDTVGAGDGFNAGWITGMLMGWSMERAIALGAVVGAFAVSSSGDSSGYPTFEEAVNYLSGREEISR